MSMLRSSPLVDPPPPYYTTAAALQAEHHDLAVTIQHLSDETIKIDNKFQAVYVELKCEEMFDQSSTVPSNEWKEIREIFTHLLWSARRAALAINSNTSGRTGPFSLAYGKTNSLWTAELTNTIIYAMADSRKSKEDKLDILKAFIEKAAPSLLSTNHAAEQMTLIKDRLQSFSKRYTAGMNSVIVATKAKIARLDKERKQQEKKEIDVRSPEPYNDYNGMKPIDYEVGIKIAQSYLENRINCRNALEEGIRGICINLDTIPDRVGSAFSALWLHEKNDAEKLYFIVENSPSGIVYGETIISGAYIRIIMALSYYGTNLTFAGP
ncbi:hypothetical protein CTheo_6386 [Ceratobasidium theobromae]|uniref:Uncharacterized protein n=1 Tax=Ceratobasidium theobromae TaxID=1582974 RepID=A0A5N5QFC3_9AGAM|nr:hypothetical protein CTheo_6386 [Ceratobasidium theobromae]